MYVCIVYLSAVTTQSIIAMGGKRWIMMNKINEEYGEGGGGLHKKGFVLQRPAI